jgi:sigma-B regulation protein RsbU (phosphoserine phosphatase)
MDPDTYEQERTKRVARFRRVALRDQRVWKDALSLLGEMIPAPIAFISLLDVERELFLAGRGFAAHDLPRRSSFSNRLQSDGSILVISDTSQSEEDARIASAVALSAPRFVAVAPMVSSEGDVAGAVGVMGPEPYEPTGPQLVALTGLARMLMGLIEDRAERQWLRDRFADQDPITQGPEKDVYLLHSLMENLPQNIYFKDTEGRFIRVNRAMAAYHGLGAPEDVVGKTDFDLFSDEHARPASEDERKLISGELPMVWKEEKETFSDGRVAWVLTTKLPLKDHQGKIIGTFGVSSDITERKQAQLREQEYARQLGEINQRLERDLQLASELQVAFLPPAGSVFPADPAEGDARVSFTHLYLPSAAVGGDYYTLHPLGDNGVGVFFCDVMGHGVRSALIMAVIGALVQELRDVATEPGRFLTLLNQRLREIPQGGSPLDDFATAFYAAVDISAGRMQFANAGHPSPLHIRRSTGGTVSRLIETRDLSGPALGLFPDVKYPVGEISLTPDDALVMFTDGISEAEDHQGYMLGEARLESLISELADQRMEALLSNLMERVREIVGHAHFEDDVCLVGMEYVRMDGGAPQPAAQPVPAQHSRVDPSPGSP